MQKSKFFLALYLFLCPVILFAQTPIYTEEQASTPITVTQEQPKFIIRLQSNATTGYRWSAHYDKMLFKAHHHYESSYDPAKKDQLVGAPGYETWTFEYLPQPKTSLAKVKNTDLSFSYQRKWEKEPVKQLVFHMVLS